MKRKKVKFYVAFDATWDILTVHDTYRDSFKSMNSLTEFIPDKLTILVMDKDGVIVPIQDYLWFYQKCCNSSLIEPEEVADGN